MSTSHRDQKCFFSTLYSDGGLFCYSAWVCTLSLLSVLTIVLRLFSLVCFGLLCYCFLFLDVKTVFVLTRFLLFFYFFCFVCLDCFLFVLPVKTVSLLSVLTSLFASFCFLFGFVLLGFFYFYLFFLFCLLFHLWRLYHWSRSSQVCLLRFVFFLALFSFDSFISISFFVLFVVLPVKTVSLLSVLTSLLEDQELSSPRRILTRYSRTCQKRWADKSDFSSCIGCQNCTVFQMWEVLVSLSYRAAVNVERWSPREPRENLF